MVFLVDDLLGLLTTKPFMFIIDQIRQTALREMYPLKVIKSLLKENRMEYELGEITKEEYEEGKVMLEDRLRIAQEVHEKHLSKNVTVL